MHCLLDSVADFTYSIYFASKMLFVKFTAISKFQIINQLVLLLLLFVLFRCFASIDSKLENLPKPIKTVITFISTITLEIYLVQLPLIHKINFLPFPANWFFITAVIILLAFLLNKITNPIYSFFKKALDKHKKWPYTVCIWNNKHYNHIFYRKSL